MAGVLRYKFKSELSYENLLFDGMFLSVGELKRQIAEKRNMTAMELDIHMSDTMALCGDDSTLLPRNTQVIISRVPLGPQTKKLIVANRAAKQAERAAQNSQLNMTSMPKESGRGNRVGGGFGAGDPSFQQPLEAAAAGQDETAALSNFVDATYSNWSSEVNAGMRGRAGAKRKFHSDLPPPKYVCHRCGNPGHWIYNCPTNGNPDYDIRKVKAPVGIPLEKLVSTGEGTIVMPDGSIGDVLVDDRILKKEATTASTLKSLPPIEIPEEMQCPICKKLAKEAVMILCCQASFCDSCIRGHLIETGTCPKCGKKDMLCDDLLPNQSLRKAIQNHVRSHLKPQATLSIEKDKGKVDPATQTLEMNATTQSTASNPSDVPEQHKMPSVPSPSPRPSPPEPGLHVQQPVQTGIQRWNPAPAPASVAAAQKPAHVVQSGINAPQIEQKPRFKVSAFRIPSKQSGQGNRPEPQKVSVAGAKESTGRKAVDLIRAINRILPNGPSSFFFDAFCRSERPLSQREFQHLQEDFRPKRRNSRSLSPVENPRKKRRDGHASDYHSRHSPKSSSRAKGSQKQKPDNDNGRRPSSDARPREMKRGGQRIVYKSSRH